MDDAGKHDVARALAGALDWWREAGVDYDFAAEPRSWIAAPEPVTAQPAHQPAAKPEPAPPELMGGESSKWPIDLAQFAAWWLIEPSLDAGNVSGRIAPRGPDKAQLMVLVEHPEAQDRDALLSGTEGKLLSAMLAAMGIAPDRAYVASVLPRHTPMADWSGLAAQGLGEVTRHHVALAAPQRLIVFGSNILPLLGHDLANNRGSSCSFNHDGATIPVLPVLSLAALQATPRRKAAVWRDWLEWTGTGV